MHPETATNSIKNFLKIPLRLVLVVPFVLQIFIAVGLTGYLSLKNGQRAVNELSYQLMDKTNDLVKQNLDTYLTTPHKLHRMTLNAIELEQLKWKDLKGSGRYFWKQIQVFNDVSYIGYALPNGEFAGSGRFLKNQGVTIDERSLNTSLKNYTYATDRNGTLSKQLSFSLLPPRGCRNLSHSG